MTTRSLLIMTVIIGPLLAMRLAHAQSAPDAGSNHNELYISWGIGSIQEIGLTLGSAIGVAFSDGTETVDVGSTGAIGIGYSRNLTPRWTFGLMLNFLRYSSTVNSTVSVMPDKRLSQTRDDILTLMARTDIRWVNARYLQLYSSLAFGGAYDDSYQVTSDGVMHSTFTGWAAQVNLLGLRIGHDFGAFVELGFGFNGLVAGGVSDRF